MFSRVRQLIGNWTLLLSRAKTFAGVAALISFLTFAVIRQWTATDDVMVIWPVDGAILAMMLGPCRKTPALTLIAGKISVVCVTWLTGNDSFLSLAMSAASAASTLGIYIAMRKFSSEDKFTDSRWLLTFLAASAVAAANTGLWASLIFPLSHGKSAMQFFLTNASSNAVGYVCVTPLTLMLMRPDFKGVRNLRQAITGLAFAAAYCALVAAVFVQSRYPLLYIVPFALTAFAYFTDYAVVALVACMVTFTAATAFVCTLLGLGPFALTRGTLSERILMLQLFMAVLAAAALPMAALMAEHRRLKASLIAAREEAENANHAKSVFLATVSHEIRTPLNGVLGMAQALSLDELSIEQREKVDVVRRSGESLLSLLNDVLDLSKIEAGKIDLERLEFRLSDLLEEAVGHFRLIAAQRGLTLTLDMGDADGSYVGDPTRIRQVLYNLVSNALKFTQEGAIAISAHRADGRLAISVTDTGMGIPTGRLEAVFSKFSQVDASTTRRFGGTGLGLSICRELVTLMGGDITAQSQEGVGSRFTFSLPLERQEGSRLEEPGRPPLDQGFCSLEADPERRLRVLAAEDNSTNQIVLRTLLEHAPVDLTVVDNGLEAVEAWRAGGYDLILMDIQMPVMDGPDAAKAIREEEARSTSPRTPIIALTANTMAHQIGDYLACGMDAHLAKPIRVQDLYALIAAYSELAQTRTDAMAV